MWSRGVGGKKKEKKIVSDGSPGMNRIKVLDQRLIVLSWHHCFIRGACAGAGPSCSKFPQDVHPSVPGSERAIFGSVSQISLLKAKVLSGHSASREHLFFSLPFSHPGRLDFCEKKQII